MKTKVQKAAYMRKYRKTHKCPLSANKNRNVQRLYKITPERYQAKLASQNNLCGMCGEPFAAEPRGLRPALDHNHATGELRDFVHQTCNVAIGLLSDSPKKCRQAAEYLERHVS